MTWYGLPVHYPFTKKNNFQPCYSRFAVSSTNKQLKQISYDENHQRILTLTGFCRTPQPILLLWKFVFVGKTPVRRIVTKQRNKAHGPFYRFKSFAACFFTLSEECSRNGFNSSGWLVTRDCSIAFNNASARDSVRLNASNASLRFLLERVGMA